jgi:hypothetical protein
VLALLVGAALAHSAVAPRWTVPHARAVLASHPFAVVDESQSDEPDYDLVFTRGEARRLRRSGAGRFAYVGPAFDRQTDETFAVRFTLTSRGRIVGFHGPAADTSQPSLPIRASFYYAWYPEAWSRGVVYPYTRFHPSLDFYAATDASVERRQTEAMLYAHLNAGIYSWWGRGTDTDVRFWRYLAVARTTPLRWAVYYEHEGYADPSVDEIRADLEYIRDLYAYRPAYLKVDGRFVVFVYGDAGDSCSTVERWRAANAGIGAYLVMKAFAGYASCPEQPDAWHQYSGSRDEYAVTTAFMISPGFDSASEQQPRLARDPGRWRQDIADMVASNLPWQLVISFNEWPEGTAVEDAREWQTPSGYGAYLDALHAGLP